MTAENAESAKPGKALDTLRADRYAILRVMAEGGQADTLEALDKKDGRLVAIKRFRVKGASSWKDVELAEREARVLMGLDHSALPIYVDHFEEDGCLYLVMVKMEGESLATLLARGVRFSESDVIALLHAGAAVLEYLHARQTPLIHRDIKPGNIIWRPDGSFGIVDFGSVRDSLKPEGGSTVVGTFGYMAPEQFQGRALPATDVYGLGATAITLLSGAAPEALPHRGLAIDVPRSLAGLASPELIRVLTWMVTPDPDPRSQPLRQLLRELPRPVFQPLNASPGRAEQRSHPASPRNPTEPARGAAGQRSAASARPSYGSAQPQPTSSWPQTEFGAGSSLASPVDVFLSNPFVLVAARVGLFAARLATWLLFELFLATAFTILSIFIKPFGDWATAFSRIGRNGRAALRQAADAARDRAGAAKARSRQRRGRKSERAQRRQRVAVEQDYREYAAEEREAAEYDQSDFEDEPRRRRRRR